MSDNQEKQTEKGFENVEVALTRTEQFIEKNQKAIIIGAAAIIAVIALVWLVNAQFVAPRKAEAQKELFNAQYYFEQDSFRIALEGDGMCMGLVSIIDEYSSTPAGNLAQYYAGLSHLNLGEFEQAKSYFKAFKSDDEFLSAMAIGLAGDADVELGNVQEAISAYNKAVATKHKAVAPIYLMKLGALLETNGKHEEAKQCFQTIIDDYPSSIQNQVAEKYLMSVGK